MYTKNQLRKYKRIIIRNRPQEIFPDHKVEYKNLYKMFRRVAAEVYLSENLGTQLRYIIKIHKNIARTYDFPYYKYRLHTWSEIIENLARYYEAESPEQGK